MLKPDEANAIYEEHGTTRTPRSTSRPRPSSPTSRGRARKLPRSIADNVAAWIDRADVLADMQAALHAEFTADNGVGHGAAEPPRRISRKSKAAASIHTGPRRKCFAATAATRSSRRSCSTRFSSRHVTLSARRSRRSATGGATASVTLADGTRVEGDDVILAVPPSVWSKIAIDPPLVRALTPQMGHNVKFLLRAAVAILATRRSLAEFALRWRGPGRRGKRPTISAGPGRVLVAFSGGRPPTSCRGWAAADARANVSGHARASRTRTSRRNSWAHRCSWTGQASHGRWRCTPSPRPVR